eukprot:TRINITY_DN1692_c0_g1_i1.p1 TRINITY_DN1692_c0_g1~~TRINITY_DN1692_c0_g1_i1.p1  ORF type:complete len:770 (+),score=28.66 TRINITY_DN1692_c0_g1_i1:348-2312(+)
MNIFPTGEAEGSEASAPSNEETDEDITAPMMSTLLSTSVSPAPQAPLSSTLTQMEQASTFQATTNPTGGYSTIPQHTFSTPQQQSQTHVNTSQHQMQNISAIPPPTPQFQPPDVYTSVSPQPQPQHQTITPPPPSFPPFQSYSQVQVASPLPSMGAPVTTTAQPLNARSNISTVTNAGVPTLSTTDVPVFAGTGSPVCPDSLNPNPFQGGPTYAHTQIRSCGHYGAHAQPYPQQTDVSHYVVSNVNAVAPDGGAALLPSASLVSSQQTQPGDTTLEAVIDNTPAKGLQYNDLRKVIALLNELCTTNQNFDAIFLQLSEMLTPPRAKLGNLTTMGKGKTRRGSVTSASARGYSAQPQKLTASQPSSVTSFPPPPIPHNTVAKMNTSPPPGTSAETRPVPGPANAPPLHLYLHPVGRDADVLDSVRESMRNIPGLAEIGPDTHSATGNFRKFSNSASPGHGPRDVMIAESEVKLNGIVPLIYNKAITEPSTAQLFARLCARLYDYFGDEESNVNQLFQLTNQLIYQVKFESYQEHRSRSIGNAVFLGFLFIEGVLPVEHLYTKMDFLLHASRFCAQTPEGKISAEVLYCLLDVVGSVLDQIEGRERLNFYMTELSTNVRSTPEIAVLVERLIRNRASGWKQPVSVNKQAGKVPHCG